MLAHAPIANGLGDDGFWQQRYAEACGDAGDDRIERSELENPRRRHAACGEERLKALAVRTASPQYDQLEIAAMRQRREATRTARRDQNEFFAKYDFADQIAMIHRTANERAIDLVSERLVDQLAARTGAQHQI